MAFCLNYVSLSPEMVRLMRLSINTLLRQLQGGVSCEIQTGLSFQS